MMKKFAWGLIPVVVLAFVVVLALSKRGNEVHAQGNSNSSGKAAVLLLCEPNFFQNPPGGYTVIIADSSPSAPPIQRGTPCADALEILFNEGFAIRDVSEGRTTPGALYTLVRPIGLANHGN